MNEEDNISIDLEAETSIIAPLINPNEIESGTNYSGTSELPLPESVYAEPQPSISLPEATILGPTPTTENISSTLPQYSEILSNLFTGFDPEVLYQKTESLEKQIQEIGTSVNDLQQHGKGSWINSRDKNNFEERPTVTPTNLIFENRILRMSSRPEWA
jgi:hypothetical protein